MSLNAGLVLTVSGLIVHSRSEQVERSVQEVVLTVTIQEGFKQRSSIVRYVAMQYGFASGRQLVTDDGW